MSAFKYPKISTRLLYIDLRTFKSWVRIVKRKANGKVAIKSMHQSGYGVKERVYLTAWDVPEGMDLSKVREGVIDKLKNHTEKVVM